MKLTLGINDCFAVKRWPRPDEWAQIIADELKLHTIQHSLDLSVLTDPADDAQEIRDACELHDLTVDSVFTGLSAYSTNMLLDPSPRVRERAEQYWRDAIRFAAAVGATSVGGHAGSFSRTDANDPGTRVELWTEMHTRLRTLAEAAHRHRLDALLVENMACDREPSRMSDFDALLSPRDDDHAAIELCLDVGHQCVPGVSGDDADPYAWLASMAPRTRVVHLQQSDAEGDHHWPFTAEFNARGRIEPEAVIEALAHSGVDAMTLILEIIPAFEARDEQVLADLRESVTYWQHALLEHQP